MENTFFDESWARLFGASDRIGPDSDDFFAVFYGKFLQVPGVGELFASTDLERQAGMLRQSMFHLVSYHITHTASTEFRRLAELHHQLGVPIELYDQFVDCLVATVADLDPKASLLTEYAWRLALAPGIEFIKLWGEFHDGPQLSGQT